MSLGVLRRPTLVTVVVVSSYGGLKGLLWFLVACPSSDWLSGAALGDVGSTLLWHVFLCSDVTSNQGNTLIITEKMKVDEHALILIKNRSHH